MNISLNMQTSTSSWKLWFEINWTIALFTLFYYSYLSLMFQSDENNADEYIVQCVVCIIYFIGLYGARLRFYQYLNLRMFALTIGASFFLLALTLRAMNVISSSMLSIALFIYILFMIYVVFVDK